MSLAVEMYNTSSGYNVINKTLTDRTVFTGAFNSEVDLDNPWIHVYNVNAPLDFDYNYCYIPQFDRYYFIDSYTAQRNSHYLLYLSIDVLMTFKTEILAMRGKVVNSDSANPYITGYVDTYDVRRTKQVLEFEDNFNSNGEIILVAVRGDLT